MSSTPDEPVSGAPAPGEPPYPTEPPAPAEPPYPAEPAWASAPPPPPPPADQPPVSPPPPAGGAYGAPQMPYQQSAYPAAAGAPLSPNDEKTWSLAAHLLCLVGGFVAPLIIWLVFKGRGPFLEHHAKEALNFQITVMIAWVVTIITAFILIGFVLMLVVLPWMIVMPIIAAVKASSGEWYRYPLTIRFVN